MTALLLLTLAQSADPLAKSVRVSFDPPEAHPGQTVTLNLTVTLPAGSHTYPTRQPEKAAADSVTRFKFPDAGAVVFVGEVADPAKFHATPDADLGVKELRTLTGTVTFTRKLVVNPAQPAGPLAVKLPEVRLLVCTGSTCRPAKLAPTGTLTVRPGAVAVEPAHAEAVKKALAGL